jgi:hypothetical protein
VRFLPGEGVVLDRSSAFSEDSSCCSRVRDVGVKRADAARPKRPNASDGPGNAARPPRRGLTGRRVELGRYRISEGERTLYGQRVDGVVRVTDVPLATGGRAYLVERGLEEEGPNANASLQALIADYLDQARRLQRCPLERDALLTDARATTQLAPEATKDSPFAVMVKYGVDTWPEAIAARAAARREADQRAKRSATRAACASSGGSWGAGRAIGSDRCGVGIEVEDETGA